MMNCPLGIITPHLGALSESFIKRHIEGILPGRTAVITGTVDDTYLGHWSVTNPQVIIDRIPVREVPNGLRQHIGWAIAHRLGRETPDCRPDTMTIVKRFLRNHGVRVILSEYLDHSLPWLTVAQELNIPFFAHAHGYDVSFRLRDPHWQQQYQSLVQAAGVITVSEASRARLLAMGFSDQKVHVVPCGVDVPAQPQQRRETQHIRCLAVGRMVGKKAPILVLDAFRRAAKVFPGLLLDYIGAGELLVAARHFVDAFNLHDQVTLHGGQPHARVIQCMQEADLFIQHSVVDPLTGDEEGLPVSVLEAMAQGIPVVATDHAGIPEAVRDGETGFLVKEGDSASMAGRIVTLAGDPSLRRNMGTTGWQRVRKHFSWDYERGRLLELLALEKA